MLWCLWQWWIRSHEMSNDTKFQMARNVKWHKMSNDTKCQMTQNVKWHKISNGTKCQMTRTFKWHKMTHDTWHMTHDKWQIRHDKWHMKLNFKLHITHMTHDTWGMMYDAWHMTHDDQWLRTETPGVTHFGAYIRPPDVHFFQFDQSVNLIPIPLKYTSFLTCSQFLEA